MSKCDCLNGETLFVINYNYTMFEKYEDCGVEVASIATASAVDEATAILKFKRYFTANIDRRCPFEYVDFDIMDAKRIMIL